MRRLTRLVPVVALVWLLAGIPTFAPAQESPAIAGYNLSAWGSGVTFTYSDPNSAIPARPTGEMHGAYSIATLIGGPAGHGVAAALWPGETAATVPPFIESTFWTEFSNGWRGGSGQDPPISNPRIAPRWPLAAETFHPQGPADAEVPPVARSSAGGNVVTSQANAVPLELPGVFEVEGAASFARNDLSGTEASATVRSSAEGIRLFNGFVTIEQVATTAKVVSDGAKAAIEGQTVISGLTINGQGYTIDKDGIHAGEDDHENPILGQINDNGESALADQGITMTLAQAIDVQSGAQASRSVGGLIIRMDSRRFQEFVDGLPEELQNRIRGELALSTDHTLTLVLGAANVSAAAAPAPPPFEFDFPAGNFGGGDFDAGDFGDTAVLSAGVSGGFTPTGGSVGAIPAPVPTGGDNTFVNQSAFSAPIEIDGVSAVAALMGLGAIVGAARVMNRWADTLLQQE